jgi:hypothetical protein
VLDLDHGGSRVIGDRAFHRDPRVVTMLASRLMHGLLRAGMAHCAKHFPGHGHVAADSHVDIPIDRRSLKAVLPTTHSPTRGWPPPAGGDAGAHHLPEGRRAPGRVLGTLAAGGAARSGWASMARSSATTFPWPPPVCWKGAR